MAKAVKGYWICKYCEQLNPASTDTCISCGSVRDEENLDYFENHINKNGNQDFTISHEQVKSAKDGKKMYAVQEKINVQLIFLIP